MNKGKQKA